jgi:predicted O-methyltransferase YrrM
MPDTTGAAKAWNGAMSANAFMVRFGGSCRTKHVVPMPTTRLGWLRFAWSNGLSAAASQKRRLYPVPARTGLPREFIGLDPWEAEYLFLAASLAEEGIVEIGRFRGGSAFLLACANVKVPIWSIDPKPVDDEELRKWFETRKVGENVQLLIGDSHGDPLPEIQEFDLLFVDGNHRYDGIRADLDIFYPRLAPGGSVLLHDCYGAREVQRAVLDFIADNGAGVEVVRSYIPAAHWRTEHGSIAHLRKPVGDPPAARHALPGALRVPVASPPAG